jgi:hypothetical protein
MILMLAVSLAMRHGKPGNGLRLNKASRVAPSNPEVIGSTVYGWEGVDWKIDMLIYNITPAKSRD